MADDLLNVTPSLRRSQLHRLLNPNVQAPISCRNVGKMIPTSYDWPLLSSTMRYIPSVIEATKTITATIMSAMEVFDKTEHFPHLFLTQHPRAHSGLWSQVIPSQYSLSIQCVFSAFPQQYFLHSSYTPDRVFTVQDTSVDSPSCTTAQMRVTAHSKDFNIAILYLYNHNFKMLSSVPQQNVMPTSNIFV
jgi:hypothetical protein